MSLFDKLVSQAITGHGELSSLRAVVEKELLHHDIMREMSKAGLLDRLTFIGGTCLRACYGSNRLSEDLDFTGGRDFSRRSLENLGDILVDRLQVKYNLDIEVYSPVQQTGRVATWKLKVITRPLKKHLPTQRIHIDICAVPSYDCRPMVLLNHYGIEMGTSGLIIQAQSLEEILADKIVAFACRPNRLKNRDLWDIGWLKQQNIKLPVDLVSRKVLDHGHTHTEFLSLLSARIRQLNDAPDVRDEFIHEMRRFLPVEQVKQTVAKKEFWAYLANLVQTESELVNRILDNASNEVDFKM